jgi:TetR/AcrR family transcriptional regulator
MTAPARSRKSDIVAAAEREFSSAGYSGGRMERIAHAAGVNKQLLFHYFDSKDGLFIVALEAMLAASEPTGSDADHPAEMMRTLLASLQRTMQSSPGLLAIIADSGTNADFPGIAAAMVKVWRERQRARIQTALEEGQSRGYFRDDFDPSAISNIALAAALGTGALVAGANAPVGLLLADYCAWR